MARKPISNVKLTEHMVLSECHPDMDCRSVSWWIYDKRAGMNIGMRAETRDAAFVEAIQYWAKRAMRAEASYDGITRKVNSFLEQL